MSSIVGLITLCVTLLVTLIGTVWKAASVIQQMTSALTELRSSVAKLEAGLAQLAEMPLIKQRLEQLESAVHSDVKGRLTVIWDKMFSLDKHMAVSIERSKSSPSIVVSETPNAVPSK